MTIRKKIYKIKELDDNNRKMVKSKFSKLIKNNLLNLVILIIVVLSVSVFAANIIVKDGEMKVEKDFYINNSNFFVNTSSGNVGIGTTSPTGLLDVSGSMRVRGIFYSGATSYTGSAMEAGSGNLYINPSSSGAFTNVIFSANNGAR